LKSAAERSGKSVGALASRPAKPTAKPAEQKKRTKGAPARASGAKANVRYAAFLRGVSPMNAKMPELKQCFESAGFTNVKTVISSGNVVFDAAPSSEAFLARKAETAMQKQLGRSFLTIVRSLAALEAILTSDPFKAQRLPPKAKRVVTFLREEPKARLPLPIEVDGARILSRKGREIFTAYVPSPRGAAFMVLIEKTFGKEVTTRTRETVERVARA
jgi:uncharacterized protein (DUF1697 family)